MDLLLAFQEFFSQGLATLSQSQFGLNVLDLIIIAVVLFYAYEGYTLGFGLAALDFLSFILSFLAGLIFFDNVSPLLVSLFSLPQGFANAISFFVIALLSEILFMLFVRKFVQRLPMLNPRKLPSHLVRKLNHPLGILPGLLSAYVILSFLLTIIITLPSSPLLKQLVTRSAFGGTIVTQTASVQHALQDVFGGAVQDTFNVMTVKPQSDETVSLHFKVEAPTIDATAEQEMLEAVNKERVVVGLPEVEMDEKLRELARVYAKDMFQRGYFSHYNPEGMSPFDRMNDHGIIYVHAGENLALAPSTDLAHQGLMNSSGHRANILGKNYMKVGIGVMDGGIYGKMYVQEFTD